MASFIGTRVPVSPRWSSVIPSGGAPARTSGRGRHGRPVDSPPGHSGLAGGIAEGRQASATPPSTASFRLPEAARRVRASFQKSRALSAILEALVVLAPLRWVQSFDTRRATRRCATRRAVGAAMPRSWCPSRRSRQALGRHAGVRRGCRRDAPTRPATQVASLGRLTASIAHEVATRSGPSATRPSSCPNPKPRTRRTGGSCASFRIIRGA
jgi:hypothetical protein